MPAPKFTNEELDNAFYDFQSRIIELVADLTTAWEEGEMPNVLPLEEVFETEGVASLFNIGSANTVQRCQTDLGLMLAMASAPDMNTALGVVAKAGIVLGFIFGYNFDSPRVKAILAEVVSYMNSEENKENEIRYKQFNEASQLEILKQMTNNDETIH